MSESTEVSSTEAATAAATEGHIVQTGASSPVSFDDFESLDVAEKVQAKIEVKKEKEKEALKNDAKKTENKKVESKKQAKEQKVPETKQQEQSKEGKEEGREDSFRDPTEVQASTEKAQKVRVFKVKSGEQEVAVRGDAKFEVKIDGEKQEVALQDALNSFSGHKAVDKRLGEFGAEKQKFIEEKRLIDNTISEMAEAITQGTPQRAIMRLFEALGADPVKGMQDLKKSFIADVDYEKLAQLSPEEREEMLSKPSVDFYKEHYEQTMEHRKTEAETQQLNSQIEEVQRAHNIDDETFNRVAEELFSLKEQGRFQGVITPQLIAEAANYDKSVGHAKNLLSSVDPELTQNREAVEKVVALFRAGMSEEDVSSFISQKYSNTNSQESQDALSKKLETTRGESTTKTSKSPQNEDLWSFSQI